MSPSEELTAAAERIRKLATNAEIRTWHYDDDEGTLHDGGLELAAVYGSYEGQHISFWDPPTALLVADLLEGMAAHWATRPIADLDIYLGTPLCKLARHILGGTP
jgi:hypothetical protein